MRKNPLAYFLIVLTIVPALLFADNTINNKNDFGFQLTGLIPSSSGGVAIINNHTYQLGDKVNGYVISGIFNDYVELKNDENKIQLRLEDITNKEQLSSELIWKGIGKRGYQRTYINLNDGEKSKFDIAHVNALWAPFEEDDGTVIMEIVSSGEKTELKYDSTSIAYQDCDNLLVELKKKKNWELHKVLASIENSENEIKIMQKERQEWMDGIAAEHKKYLINQARAKYSREMKKAQKARRREEARSRYRAKRDAEKNLRGIPVIATGPIVYSPKKVEKLTTEQKEWLLIQQSAQQKFLKQMRELEEQENQEKWLRDQDQW